MRKNKDLSKCNVIDLCDTNPFCWDADSRVRALALAGKHIYRKGVSGSIAEAGVYKGNFARYINAVFPDRKMYLFDTFEGFVEKQLNEKDDENQTRSWIKGHKDTNVQTVMDKLTYPENAIVRKGIFPDTAEEVEDSFSFVNLDMDLYKPIYEGLNYFWPRLSKGGVIFVHDYDNWEGVTQAVDQFSKETQVGFVCLNDGITAAFNKPL